MRVLRAYLGFLWCFVRVMVRAPSGRQRFNVLGALHAVTHELITVTNDSYINSASVGELLEKIAGLGLTTPITVIMDNARYQRCRYVLELAARLGIEVLFLPPYSPNLNLIELALTTGMRRGELLALQWADIDGVGGILQVR